VNDLCFKHLCLTCIHPVVPFFIFHGQINSVDEVIRDEGISEVRIERFQRSTYCLHFWIDASIKGYVSGGSGHA
jgi:hypothetical protein